VSKDAARAGRAKFFEPLIAISPFNTSPPNILILCNIPFFLAITIQFFKTISQLFFIKINTQKIMNHLL
jgi:hypothetical protein